jgi:LPXTG-motif cell wall-anchored protein
VHLAQILKMRQKIKLPGPLVIQTRVTNTIRRRYSAVGAIHLDRLREIAGSPALEDQMKKYAAALVAALLALLGFTALAPSANAYPQAVLYLNASETTVVSGHTFNLTATATVNCSELTITWNGQSFSSAGSKFKHKYKAPIVSSSVVITAKATCEYGTTSGAAGHAIVATSSFTNPAYKDITVIPVHSKGGGKLPNTGGPSIGWLIGGIAALLAGAGAMYAGRRRDTGVASN